VSTVRLVVFVCAFFAVSAAPARAGLVPPLRLDAVVLADVGAVAWSLAQAAGQAAADGSGWRVDGDGLGLGLEQQRPDLTLPEHYAWVERDTRAFWYSAGTGAAATLATHVLAGLPALVFGSSLVAAVAAASPAAAFGLGFGLTTGYFFAESALSALIATLVFDGTSDLYRSKYLAALGAHFVGNVMSTGATALIFGGGLLLIHGAGLLSEFTAGGGLSALSLFSVLGAMPGIVVAGVALVVVPALVTSWAIAVTATARPGYEIDDDWRKPTALFDEPGRHGRFAAVAAPLVTFALPAP
jgi:hypothetical protein